VVAATVGLHRPLYAFPQMNKLLAQTLVFLPHLVKLCSEKEEFLGQVRLANLGEGVLGRAHLILQSLQRLLLRYQMSVLNLDKGVLARQFALQALTFTLLFRHLFCQTLHLLVCRVTLLVLALDFLLEFGDQRVQLFDFAVFVFELALQSPVILRLLLLSIVLQDSLQFLELLKGTSQLRLILSV